MRTPRYGRVSPDTAAKMAANLPERYHGVLSLLTDRPAGPIRASAARYSDDGELDEEFRALWPPKTPQEAERRAVLAASAPATVRTWSPTT